MNGQFLTVPTATSGGHFGASLYILARQAATGWVSGSVLIKEKKYATLPIASQLPVFCLLGAEPTGT